MSKEYHLYKVVKETDKPEQAYVFGIERDIVNKTLDLKEVFIFTIINGVEIKHRIDIQQVMSSMFVATKGSVPNEVMEHITNDMNKPIDKNLAIQHLSNIMLLAVDRANKNHLTMTDFNTIDEYLTYLAHKKS